MMDKREEFSQQKKTALAGIYYTDGFKVILDIMEDICNQSENEFLNTDPLDAKAVLVNHVILRSQRVYMEVVISKIDRLMEDATGIKKDNRRSDNSAQLLSALPITENEI